MSIPEIMRGLGCVIKQGQGLEKEDSLNLVKAKWPLFRFDQEKCAEGLSALRNYEWDRKATNPDGEGKPGQRKPLHNWASHPADALAIACSIDPMNSPEPAPPPPKEPGFFDVRATTFA